MILIGTIMQTKLSFIVKWLIYNFESYGDKGEGVSYIIFTMSWSHLAEIAFRSRQITLGTFHWGQKSNGALVNLTGQI